MASWANPDEGLCPECGQTNSRQWILCDKCGARLPWAPPEKQKVRPQDMTEEQLAAYFGGAARRDSFMMSMEARQVRGAVSAIVLLVIVLVIFLIVRALHLL